MYVSPEGSGDSVEIESLSGRILVAVGTTDTEANVDVVENLIQSDVHKLQDSVLTVTYTVKTKDAEAEINVQPSVTSHDIQIETDTSEDTDDEGFYVTKITSVVKTIDKSYLSCFVNTVSSVEQDEEKKGVTFRYLIMRHDVIANLLHGNPGGDELMTCQEMYSLFNIICVKMSEGMYQTLRANWPGEEIIELEETEAFYGTQFFSEIRPVAKLWEAKSPWYGEKVPTEITPEIVSYILKVMKIFARESVEQEFERRWLTMRNASAIETESWRIQQEEAKEWLEYQGKDGHKTPFLDYLAESRNYDKTELATKILSKKEAYQDKLSAMLVDMQKILKQFDDCESVWDINVLYEDYFGIGMPHKQAQALGRIVEGTENQRKPEWRVKGNGFYF